MWQQFEAGSTEIDTRVNSFNKINACCMHTLIDIDPISCGKISRVAGFQDAARFRGHPRM